MAEEIVDIFDESYNLRGKADRSLAYVYGMWLHSFHCWIYSPNDGGKVIFQKRSAEKKLFPNALDISAAGHLTTGEKPLDGVREIKEELGIDVNPNQLTPLGIKHDTARIGEVVNRQFAHVYLLRSALELDQYKVDVSEVTGLAEIQIGDGLSLFSGEKNSIRIVGREFHKSSATWLKFERDVGCNDFIPRVDPYYYKIFILVSRALAGDRHLAI